MLLETFYTALRSLSLNKARTFLTMLGVIIGVFSVISLVSLVKGVQNFVVDRFNSLGSNLIFVSPGRSGFNADPSYAFTNNKLDVKNAKAIEQYAAGYIEAVTPTIRIGKTLQYKNNKFYTTISSGNYQMFNITNFEIDKGRFFTKVEEDTKSNVIILGPKAKTELFGQTTALGNSVKIDKDTFKVIGITKSKGSRADDMAFIPYTAVQNSLNVKQISGLAIKAKNPDNIDITMKKVELGLLSQLKHDDFTVLSQKDVIASAQKILGVLGIGLTAVAGISLLVGGIGIMNIMLVSVTERTSEIGLRKALGATPFNIAIQFILEAIVISLTGGLIGLLLGWLLTIATKSILRSEVPLWAIPLGLGFSVVVGLIFGTYPAVQAAKKEPIEALRYE